MFEVPSLTRTENVSTIEINGGKIHVIYGGHFWPSRIPASLEKTIEEYDTLALEFNGDYVSDPEKALRILGYQEVQFNNYLSKSLVAEKSVYLVDTDLGGFYGDQEDFGKMILWLGGEIWLSQFLLKKAETSTQTRRAVLKTLGNALKVYAGSYLLTPVFRGISVTTGFGNDFSAECTKKVQALHPQLDRIFLKLRNLVMAYKLIVLLNSGRAYNILMFLGAAHVGIEDFLQQYAEGQLKIEDMEKTLREMKSLISGDPKTYDKIGHVKFDNRERWIIDAIQLPNL